MTRAARPRLLATGFGPFPGAPENPTADLVRHLSTTAPAEFGASRLRTAVLPTDYRRSWAALRRLYRVFAPDVVVHFGLSQRADRIQVERMGRRACRPDVPDAAGFAPRSGRVRRAGPEEVAATLPAEAILRALLAGGIPAEASDDAGAYVCNATLYRSLCTAAGTSCLIGFVHVPPADAPGWSPERLADAAALVLSASAAAWNAR